MAAPPTSTTNPTTTTTTKTSPIVDEPKVGAVTGVLEGKIKLWQQSSVLPGGDATTQKQQPTRGGWAWIGKLEVLWDLPDLLDAHDRKTLTDARVVPLMAKLTELLLASLATTAPSSSSSSSSTSGPPSGAAFRRMVGVALAALHAHVPTRQLFTLLDSLHAILTAAAKTHSLHAKLTALQALREVYRRRAQELEALLATSAQVVLKLLKASDNRLSQESAFTLMSIVKATSSKSIYEHDSIWKALTALSSVHIAHSWDKHVGVQIAATQCSLELARVQLPTGPDFEKLVARFMKHMNGPHKTLRKVVGRALGELLYLAVERQQNQDAEVGSKKPTNNKDVTWTIQSASAYLAFLFNKNGARREVRGALAEAFVSYFQALPISVVESEDELSHILTAVLSLLAPSKTQSPLNTLQVLANTKIGVTVPVDPAIESLQARECVRYILREGLVQRLGEGGQQLILRLLIGSLPSSSFNVSLTTTLLQEISFVIIMLGEGCAPHATLLSDAISPLFAASTPDSQVTWTAAMCLRALGTALPWHLATLLYQCLNFITAAHAELTCARHNQELTKQLGWLESHGYCVSAVVAASRSAPLGIPPALLTFAYQTAVSLLSIHMAPSPSDKVATTSAEVAWAIMAAIISTSPRFLYDELSNLFTMWKIHLATSRLIGRDEVSIMAFCRSKRPALAALHSLCLHLNAIAVSPFLPHILALLLPLLEVGTTLVKLQGLVSRDCGLAIIGFLYHLLAAYLALPASEYPLQAVSLLRVTAHIIIEGGFAASSLDTSLPEDGQILNPATNSYFLEAEAGLTTDGFLDPSFLWIANSVHKTALDWGARGHAAAVDVSVQLFAHLFAEQSEKNRQQLLDHFTHSLKERCLAVEQPLSVAAVTVARNILCALLCTLKYLNSRGLDLSLGGQKLRSSAHLLILGCQGYGDSMVQALVGECMGVLGKIEGPDFTDTIMPLFTAPRIKTVTDVSSRASTAYIIGSIHRNMGMKAGAYVADSVETLSLLVRDSEAAVYLPALHALALLIDSAGLQFSNSVYGKNTILLLLSRLMTEGNFESDHERTLCYRLIGRAMNALVAVLGPEIHCSPLLPISVQSIAFELRANSDAFVGIEFLRFVGQAFLFFSDSFDLSPVLPYVVQALCSPHLAVRLAAYQCLRQCAQADPKKVSEASEAIATLWVAYDKEGDSSGQVAAASLLRLLAETCGVRDTASWVSVCKQLASMTSRSLSKTSDNSPQLFAADTSEDTNEAKEGTGRGEETADRGCKLVNALRAKSIVPRWRSRILAVDCLRDMLRATTTEASMRSDCISPVELIGDDRNHNDARPKGLDLLADLVAIGFTTATSPIHSLRPTGLHLLREIIITFGHIEDPEIAGHHVLEQYQSQIAAALRPAFERDTAHPDATEVAADTLVTFFQFNVSSDPVILRRLSSLLTANLPEISQIHYAAFSDEAATRVRICLVATLARLYSFAQSSLQSNSKHQDDVTSISSNNATTLVKLLTPHKEAMKVHWIALLRDFAIGSTYPNEGQRLHAQKSSLCLFDLSLVPLPPAIIALYRRAVPPCLYSLASLLANSDSATSDGWLLPEEAEIIFGLCLRYCLEPGIQLQELSACLMAVENLMSSASSTTKILSAERVLEILQTGFAIGDRHKVSPAISLSLSHLARRVVTLLAEMPSTDQTVSTKGNEWSVIAEDLVSFVLRPLLPMASGLDCTTVGDWWSSTSMEVVIESLLTLPTLTVLAARWTSSPVLLSYAASFLLLIIRTLVSEIPPSANLRVRDAALDAMSKILLGLAPDYQHALADATLAQASRLLSVLGERHESGQSKANIITAIGLLLTEPFLTQAKASSGAHQLIAARFAQELSSSLTQTITVDAILSQLQAIVAAILPLESKEQVATLRLYYLRETAPHVGILIRRLCIRESNEASQACHMDAATTALCLKASKLLFALRSLPFLDKREELLGLVVAGLVGQLGVANVALTGRAILDMLTQVGAADPTSFKQAVGNLPQAQAELLHSHVRSAALSTTSGAASSSRLATAKAPRLDFSRYY